MGDVSLPTPSLNIVQGRKVRDTAKTKGAKSRNPLGIPGCYKKEQWANTEGAALLTPTACEHRLKLHKDRETMG